MDQIILKTAFNSLNKTKEMIYYSIQLTDAVHKELIRPEHFANHLIMPEPHSSNIFYIDLDWTKHPEIFKQTADNAQINIASFAIITCKESYSKLLWVKEEENPDLYAAQIILKLVRDAMGHMCAKSEEFAASYWDINKKNQRIFEIKELGIVLDARNLHDQQFKFSQLGGLANLLKILDYLIKDLKNKIDNKL